MQAGKGRNSHIHVCARETWLACALNDITLICTHTPGDSLLSTGDALSRFNLGGIYKDRVHELVRQGVHLKSVSDVMFSL